MILLSASSNPATPHACILYFELTSPSFIVSLQWRREGTKKKSCMLSLECVSAAHSQQWNFWRFNLHWNARRFQRNFLFYRTFKWRNFVAYFTIVCSMYSCSWVSCLLKKKEKKTQYALQYELVVSSDKEFYMSVQSSTQVLKKKGGDTHVAAIKIFNFRISSEQKSQKCIREWDLKRDVLLFLLSTRKLIKLPEMFYFHEL